jgi:transcriptional regulator GlxA family with amidase domain
MRGFVECLGGDPRHFRLLWARIATQWAAKIILEFEASGQSCVHEPHSVVTDGELITAGGVTSGIDFGLTLVGQIAGPHAAQKIQLALEYDPAPPFNGGTPLAAPPELVAELRSSVYEAAASELEDILRAL